MATDELSIMTVSKVLDSSELRNQIGTDERSASIREVLLKNPLAIEGWLVVDGCLLYTGWSYRGVQL